LCLFINVYFLTPFKYFLALGLAKLVSNCCNDFMQLFLTPIRFYSYELCSNFLDPAKQCPFIVQLSIKGSLGQSAVTRAEVVNDYNPCVAQQGGYDVGSGFDCKWRCLVASLSKSVTTRYPRSLIFTP